MMTLEEAIKHCKDVALSCTNKECALEHFQLLKWLQEYSNMLEKQGEKAKYHDICDTCVRQPTCQSDCFLQQSEQKHNPVLNIEIPFGAKDSELQEASYYIPEGFYAEIDGNRVVIKRGEQKPTEWSEEDDEMIHCLGYTVNHYFEDKDTITKCCSWLKSIKDRVQLK